MSVKPTELPRWADDVAAEIVNPTSGKKDIGWVGNETPPAQYFNWLLNSIYKWIEYLSVSERRFSAMGGTAVYYSGGVRAVALTGEWCSSDAGAAACEIPLNLPVGFVITALRANIVEGNLAGETITAFIYFYDDASHSQTQKSVSKTSGVTGAAAVLDWTTADADFPLTIADGGHYVVAFNFAQTSADRESKVQGVTANPLT